LNSPLCDPSHFTLHPTAVKMKGQLLKDEPFLERFSPQLLISSVKRA
jgi:hypothetical protein